MRITFTMINTALTTFRYILDQTGVDLMWHKIILAVLSKFPQFWVCFENIGKVDMKKLSQEQVDNIVSGFCRIYNSLEVNE